MTNGFFWGALCSICPEDHPPLSPREETESLSRLDASVCPPIYPQATSWLCVVTCRPRTSYAVSWVRTATSCCSGRSPSYPQGSPCGFRSIARLPHVVPALSCSWVCPELSSAGAPVMSSKRLAALTKAEPPGRFPLQCAGADQARSSTEVSFLTQTAWLRGDWPRRHCRPARGARGWVPVPRLGVSHIAVRGAAREDWAGPPDTLTG